MLRAARLSGVPVGRAAVRVARRRFATEVPPTAVPKKKRHLLRKFVLYTTGATATFYVSSAFVAFNVPPYHDFFIENVPLGASFLQYAEDHEWDTLTVEKALKYARDNATTLQEFVTNLSGAKVADKAKEVLEQTKEASKERIQNVTESLKTTVHKAEDRITGVARKEGTMTKHQAIQFSEGVEELARRAEDALAGKPFTPVPETTTTPEQPQEVPPDTLLKPVESAASTTVDADKAKNVYDAPLPIGFEPPPGYTKPAPPKAKTKAAAEETAPTATTSTSDSTATPPLPPLPLIAPAVAEFSGSEPVIAQLASVIDNLASYLNANPAAAEKARDVLDSAKDDLAQLAHRIEDVKLEEQRKLEVEIEEKTKDFTVKLMELEMEAQDKLDSQEESFKKYFEEERVKFVQAYREKLDRELHAQSEIINQRLKEEVIAQGIELQRRWIREVKVRVEQERGGRLAKLDELATNLKRLERIAVDNSNYLDENLRIHALWSALRAVTHTAVDAQVRKPFREELRVLRHIAAARDDPVAAAALDTLEASDVPDVGIEPFADLASWFTTSVAPKVASVALVPDQNAGLLSHLASHFLTSFTFKKSGLVEGDDVLSVLARAEYYLNEKNLDSATRELNQLRGTARVLLTDWLDAARKRLEVLQALEVVQTQATLASLLVAQD